MGGERALSTADRDQTADLIEYERKPVLAIRVRHELGFGCRSARRRPAALARVTERCTAETLMWSESARL
jgi:hypothetical protein